MASAVTTAIDALTAVVKEGIDNSKIINTLDKEISRALGLLVDLILLPFLPILIYGIVTLYMAILAFGKWWNDVTSIIKKEGLLGLIKLSLLGAWDGISNVMKGLFEYLWGDDKGKGLNLRINATIASRFDLITGWLLDLLFGEGSGKKAAQILEVSLNVIQSFFDWLIASVLDWIFGTHNAEAKFLKLQIVSAELVGLWWDLIKVVFGENPSKILSIDVALAMKNPADWLWEVVKSVSRGGLGILIVNELLKMGGFPHLASGGTIKETGLAVVHKGETVVPAGGGGGSSNTFNFYGYQDDKFIAKVRDVMRGDATRYSQ